MEKTIPTLANRIWLPWLFGLATLVAVAWAVGLWRQEPTDELQQNLELARPGVFLAVVEFGLRHNGEVVSHEVGSGTCFLVDRSRLVSNRHVFCPWTSHDITSQLDETLAEYRRAGTNLEFFWRIWVYPDGALVYRNHNLVADDSEDVVLEDFFDPPLWRSDGRAPTLRLAGAAYDDDPEDQHVANLSSIAAPLLQLKESSDVRHGFYYDAARLLLGMKPSQSGPSISTDEHWEKSMRSYVRYLAQMRAAHQKEAVRDILEAWRAADLTEEDSLLIARDLDLLKARRWLTNDWRSDASKRFKEDSVSGIVN